MIDDSDFTKNGIDFVDAKPAFGGQHNIATLPSEPAIA
jgi:hypothetical protein